MKRRGVWIAAAVVAVALVALGWWGYGQVKQFEALAKAGKSDASAAVKSLEQADAAAALASFQRAGDEFGRARQLLGPAWLRDVPWLGRQVAAADELASIGAEGSSAGAHVAELLVQAGSVSGPDRLGQLIVAARPHLDSALASLVVVAQRSDALTTDGLVPQLADAVTELRRLLEPMQLVLSRSQAMLDLERYLYSGDHTFLVVAQNNSELRPTGGFMGTFGLIRFGPDGVALNSFADIYRLPRDTLDEPVPEGGQVVYRHFYFRNANWWMDFPTSARMMLKFWANMQQPQVDGIVAVDIPLLQALLTVHGPVTVPESSEPITAQNAMLLLNEVVQYEKSGQARRADRKLAIVSLVDELFGWMTGLPADRVKPVLDALVGAASQKHVQIYFADSSAQAAIVQTGWSGALAPPEGTTDLVAVSNGVIKPSKANYGVSKTLNYTVEVNPDGSADTTLKLGYTKSPRKLLGVPQQWLANYVRVHRLAGTIAPDAAAQGPAQPGTTEPAASEPAFAVLRDATGLPTFGHYFRLDPGASTTVELNSTVPQAVQRGAATAIPGAPAAAEAPGGEVWHYRLLLAKQADLVDTQASISVAVPSGWKVASAVAWRRVGGQQIDTTTTATGVSLATPLKQDVILDVSLVKA